MILRRISPRAPSPPSCGLEVLSDPRYQEFFNTLGSTQNLSSTLQVFKLLTPDKYLLSNIALFEEKLCENKPFWELCCALNGYTQIFKPRSYLEIGVRRGRSMAQVAFHHPTAEIVGFDLWIPDYAGEANPGPEFVEKEIQRLGFRGTLTLIQGKSQKTVPPFLKNRGRTFDLITVDGDHSPRGARKDLQNVVPWVAVGGIVLFDDITHPQLRLRQVWEWFKRRYQEQFVFVENLQDMHGTGLAIRIR